MLASTRAEGEGARPLAEWSCHERVQGSASMSSQRLVTGEQRDSWICGRLQLGAGLEVRDDTCKVPV